MEKNGIEKSHEYSIDLFKAIACIFIIFIHCKLPGTAGGVMEALARFGVPLFFAVSGRFLIDSDTTGSDEIRRVMKNKIKRLSLTICYVWLFYLFYSMFYFNNAGETFFRWFHEKFNLFEFSRLILFNSGKFIYDYSIVFDHLWFLFALLYVYILCFVFAKVLRKWSGFLTAILLSFLYLAEMLKIYYPIRPFDISISTWYVVRNWLFVGIPFTMLGFWLKDNEERYKSFNSKGISIFFVVFGCLVTVFEFYIWGTREIYLGSFLTVLGLMTLSGYVRVKENSKLAAFGRKHSANIYYFHVFIISAVGLFTDRFLPGVYEYPLFWWIRPFVVIIITTVFSLLLRKLKTNKIVRKYRL